MNQRARPSSSPLAPHGESATKRPSTIGRRQFATVSTLGAGALAASACDKHRPHVFHLEGELVALGDTPTLVDILEHRVPERVKSHLLATASRAQSKGAPEELVFACLVHDLGVLFHGVDIDHDQWSAQLLAPYVSEAVRFAIAHHFSVKFFDDPALGYRDAEGTLSRFKLSKIPDSCTRAHARAVASPHYMMTRSIGMLDVYPKSAPPIAVSEFTDIIGRHFRQPPAGLGKDGSPTAHMWRRIVAGV